MKEGIWCQLSFKMERVVLVVLVAVAMLNAPATAQDNTTTLQEFFLGRYGLTTLQMSLSVWSKTQAVLDLRLGQIIKSFSGNVTTLPLRKELLQYLLIMQSKIVSEFAYDLGNVTLQSIYQDLNDHCGEYLETPIEDLTDQPNNVTCVVIRLRKTLSLMLKTDIEVSLQELSRQCIHHRLPFCSAIHTNCTAAYEETVGKLLINYVEDANEVDPAFGSTPGEIILQYLLKNVVWLLKPYMIGNNSLTLAAYLISTVHSIEPLTVKNILRFNTNKDVERQYFKYNTTAKTQEQLTWGIVKSGDGSVGLPCSHYRDTYRSDPQQYSTVLHQCYSLKVMQSNLQLINCVYTDPALNPLSWSTVPSAYFHSQCLCLAYNGTECGVKAPQGVDPRLYCLSVLLRDFQRRISYRPAVTYLDYAFQTRVPDCQLVNLLRIGFKRDCIVTEISIDLSFILSLQCYFKDLVNKNLNCSETRLVNTYNHSVLCGLQYFMDYVLCDDEGDVEVRVPFYGAGDSTLVLFLTYLDVAVRVLTLVTYVACPELRNLPGKVLIGYQVTALLRLLVVRATLEDLALAVRFDVSMDLATTLWLFSYLHFLTVSIKALRPPDSLRPDEARMVLFRYAMLGWALPAALSAVFFWMDGVIDTRVQYGQLLFLLCNYAALFGNLYMAFKNSHFYYDVRSNASILQRGGKARSVLADLFNFAIKTSVLSGAGITFRLVFTQIQGLEHLLGYYHALGTLQALLLFFLYGCNREARAFWQRVVCSKLPQCRRRPNNCV